MNFDRENFPGAIRSPTYCPFYLNYSIQIAMQNQCPFPYQVQTPVSQIDYCCPQSFKYNFEIYFNKVPPPSKSYIEHVPVTRVQQECVPVVTQEMVPVERKQIEYVPQITNDIHHFHETQVQPTILESKQVFTHAGLEQIPVLQKQLLCQKHNYQELLKSEQEKVSLLQNKITFMNTNYEDQLRDQKRCLDEKDAFTMKLQKEIQYLRQEESMFKERESNQNFFEKKIQLLKLKNKEMELENEKCQSEFDKYKQQCKELEKKLKKSEENNQSLQCATVKFNEQLLMIKEQYEQEISNLRHTLDGLQLDNIKLTKKYKKLSCKKCYEKTSPPKKEIQKENFQQQSVLMPIPQVQYQEPIIKKKKHKKKKVEVQKQAPQPIVQQVQVKQIVKPCIPADPAMPKSVVNLHLKQFDDCTCL